MHMKIILNITNGPMNQCGEICRKHIVRTNIERTHNVNRGMKEIDTLHTKLTKKLQPRTGFPGGRSPEEQYYET